MGVLEGPVGDVGGVGVGGGGEVGGQVVEGGVGDVVAGIGRISAAEQVTREGWGVEGRVGGKEGKISGDGR